MHLIHGTDKCTCTTELSNHIGRLKHGVGNRIKRTNTIFFIHRSGVPAGKRFAFVQIFVSISTNKTETHKVRIAEGGDNISYEGPTATQ